MPEVTTPSLCHIPFRIPCKYFLPECLLALNKHISAYLLPEYLSERIALRAEWTTHHYGLVVVHHVGLLVGSNGRWKGKNYGQHPDHDGGENGKWFRLWQAIKNRFSFTKAPTKASVIRTSNDNQYSRVVSAKD